LSGDVLITDPEFEACLRQSVRPLRPQDGLQPGQPISRDRACRVTRIECESRGIKEVNGIENFTHLTVLNLNYNQLTRIDISELTEIEMLLLGRNKLTDIGDISRLSRMHTLWLGYNELRSLKLDGLTNLKDLRVDGNQLKEITGLQTNPNLDILVLSQNPELPCRSLGISAALLAASGCGTR
jgi:Leucine-rich repeat (LRR) protein